MRTGLFGNSLYYAHLDQIAIEDGTAVKLGDTLGFVGNTGNAKGTPPHLHFGIYRNFGGAVDPLPFVFQPEKVDVNTYKKQFSVAMLKVKTSKATLRQSPAIRSGKLGELNTNEVVTLLGETKEWLHVETANGQRAFIHSSLVKAI